VTKAFAYLTVSGEGQIDGDSFLRQLAGIRSYAKTHAVRIVQVFEEKGVSGTNDLENRPAFLAMMEALHSDGVKLVLVESLGRLARDLMIQESILHDLKRSGFGLVSVHAPDLCSDDPSRKLMRQIMGAFHEHERSMIVIKLRGARQRAKARHGKCEGRKPYGYFEGEDAIIQRMTELRQAGLGFDEIAAALNNDGVKPRSGQRWHGFTLNWILKAHGVK
jgi:DNA invertase Pin-like site-specific DNA recombinase